MNHTIISDNNRSLPDLHKSASDLSKVSSPNYKTRYKLLIDPYTNTPMFQKLKKSVTFINSIKETDTKHRPTSRIKIPSVEKESIYDIVNRVRNSSISYTTEDEYEPILEYLKSVVKTKLNADLRESKIMSLFEIISKSISTKLVPKDEFVFGKGDTITGLYILVDGKVGLSSDTEEKLSILQRNGSKSNFSLSSFCFEIIDEADSFV